MPCAGILIDFIYAWGDNGYGQLGVNSCDSHIATPKLVESLARKVTVQLACGANHTLALTADGELYTWGQNTFGQLGLRHQQGPQKDPALVTSLAGTPLVLLAAAGHHSAAVTQAGYLLLWGSNKQGQLGYTPKGDPLVCNVVVQILNSAHQSSSERDQRALVSSLRLLSLVHGLNFQAGCRVGWLNYDDFYIPEIAEKIDIRNDYLNWMNSRLHPMSRRESPILFCEYPFLFDPQAKMLLLRCDATRQMRTRCRTN
ncbi:probable E3 ubiquitin-protein ligase HERC4 [Scylla paramamosain]|uniref:probable E3 ubiquitin-protein ligase HERC4 n=1 Tax=Scylla paramamosain TaxID=85552 RepID=UPI003083CFA2